MKGNVDESNGHHLVSLERVEQTASQQYCHNTSIRTDNFSNIQDNDAMVHLRSNGHQQNGCRKPNNNVNHDFVHIKQENMPRELKKLSEPFMNYPKVPLPPGRNQQKPNPHPRQTSGNAIRKEQQSQNCKERQAVERNLRMLSDAGNNLRQEREEQGTFDQTFRQQAQQEPGYHWQGKENQCGRGGALTAKTADSRPLPKPSSNTYNRDHGNLYNGELSGEQLNRDNTYNAMHQEKRGQHVYQNFGYDNEEDAGDFLAEYDDLSEQGEREFQARPSPIKLYGSSNGYTPQNAAAMVSCNRGDCGEESNEQEENLGHILVLPPQRSSNMSTGEYSSLDKSAFEKAYIKDCQKKGILDDHVRLASEARTVARDKAWKLYKFLTPAFMEYDSQMATMIMEEMGLYTNPYDGVFQSHLWTRIKKDVLTGHGQARSGATQRIQKAFFDLLDKKLLPELKSMEAGRQCQDSYVVFAMNFASGVGKAVNWKENIKSRKFSEIVNTSDEAMALLILANNWNVWMKMAAKNKTEGKPKLKQVIDEGNGVTQRFFSKDGRGFSFNIEGKKYYNEMFKKIKADREEYGQDFDNHLYGLVNKNNKEQAKVRNKKRRHIEDADFFCEHDGDAIAGYHRQLIADRSAKKMNGGATAGMEEQLRSSKTALYQGEEVPVKEV